MDPNEATPVTPQASGESPEVPVETPSVEPTQETPPQETSAESPPSVPERVVPTADGYKLPEGLDPAVGQFASENGYTQEQLDKTLEYFGEVVQNTDKAKVQALRVLGEAHLKNWGDAAQTNLNLAKQALAQNDPDGHLAKALNESGYGNHPAVLDFLYNLGKGMQEGGFLKTAVNRPPGQKSLAQKMYPSHVSKE